MGDLMNNGNLYATSQKVSAIVCAHNEEKTIQGVMDALLQSPAIAQVIAVDDGSTDRTADLLRRYRDHERARLILLAENRGKGFAMITAAAQASAEILLFVDADLRNLSEKHIALLLGPILAGDAHMVIGVPIRADVISPAERLDPCRPLSGQRAVYCQEFLHLEDAIRHSGYGVETILNLHYRKQGKRVQTILLPYLHHPIKVEKTDFASALPEYWHEGRQILQTAVKNPKLVWGALRSALAGR